MQLLQIIVMIIKAPVNMEFLRSFCIGNFSINCKRDLSLDEY